MSSRGVARRVALLAFPAIAQQLLHTLVFLVDRSMLGHHGEASLASMQISGPLVWSVFSVLSSFTVGAIALVGRRVGAEDAWGANAALRVSILASLGLGLGAALLGWLTLPMALTAFGEASDLVADEARSYLVVAFPAMPLALVSFTVAVSLQAAGDTKTPLFIAGLGNALNVVVSGVLVFGLAGFPSMGARGAAFGTAAALAFQCLVLLGWTGRETSVVSWRGRGGERDALRRIARVSGPSLIERVIQHAGFLGFVAMIGALGTRAMAANQALISIESIIFLSADGFGIAAAALASQRLGANDPRGARAAVRVAVWMGTLGLGVCGTTFIVFPEPLLALFTDEPQVIALAAPCMLLAALCAPVLAASVVLGEALRGAGDTRVALSVTFLGGFVVRLVATYLFAFEFGLGLFGVWLGSTCDWVVRAASFALRFRSDAWTRIDV